METKIDQNEAEDCDTSLLLPDIIRNESRFMATLFGYRQAVDLRFVTGFRDILRSFEKLEIYCDAPTESCLNYDQCTVDLSIQEALQYPRKMAARTPMDLNTHQQFTIQHLKLMWCRLVSHYFEWVVGVPEIKQLDDIDRIRLVTKQLCKVICWTVAWRTYKLDLQEGLTFGCGLIYVPKDDCCPMTRSYASNLSAVIQRLIVSKMRNLHLNRHEYILVKLATLFSNTGDIALSHEGQEICISALNKYTTALLEELIHTREDLTIKEVHRRVSEMLQVLPHMEIVSDVDDRHLMELTLNNRDNLQGRLTTEIHVHSHF